MRSRKVHDVNGLSSRPEAPGRPSTFMLRSHEDPYASPPKGAMRTARAKGVEEMKKALVRLAALSVMLAFPVGVFAQSTPASSQSASAQQEEKKEEKKPAAKKTVKHKKAVKKAHKKAHKKAAKKEEKKESEKK